MAISNRFCRIGGCGDSRPPSRWRARIAEIGDLAAWEELFANYCEFYERPSTSEQRRRVWSWIQAGTIGCLLAVPAAVPDGRPVGLAHIRPCPSPLRGTVTGYLDDLYVAPTARGTGAFEALFGAVHRLAQDEGWALVRWITAADNARARGLRAGREAD